MIAMAKTRKIDPDIIDFDYDESDPHNQFDSDETRPQYDADDNKVDRDERRIKRE